MNTERSAMVCTGGIWWIGGLVDWCDSGLVDWCDGGLVDWWIGGLGEKLNAWALLPVELLAHPIHQSTNPPMTSRLLSVALLARILPALGQAQKKALTQADWDRWRSITAPALSPDGQW